MSKEKAIKFCNRCFRYSSESSTGGGSGVIANAIKKVAIDNATARAMDALDAIILNQDLSMPISDETESSILFHVDSIESDINPFGPKFKNLTRNKHEIMYLQYVISLARHAKKLCVGCDYESPKIAELYSKDEFLYESVTELVKRELQKPEQAEKQT